MPRRYRKKPIIIEGYSFEEFVEYGKKTSINIVDGMPWSFEFLGHPVTHENNKCYIIPTLEGDHKFTPNDVLLVGIDGEIYPCKKTILEKTYDIVEQGE